MAGEKKGIIKVENQEEEEKGKFRFVPKGHDQYQVYLAMNAEVRTLGDVPPDLRDPMEVRNRIADYFAVMSKYNCRPTQSGLALAFGIRRQRLYEFKAGTYRKGGIYKDIPEETLEEIRKAYDMLENLWESYMMNDDINPMVGTFMGVNNFGYKNTSSVELQTGILDSSDKPSIDAIKAKYIADDRAITDKSERDDG